MGANGYYGGRQMGDLIVVLVKVVDEAEPSEILVPVSL